MTSTYTQTHSHLNYRCKLGEGGGGTAGGRGGWRRLKWKSWTDQYCWRFSSLLSPLNCHALTKQLKTLYLSISFFLGCLWQFPTFFLFKCCFSSVLQWSTNSCFCVLLVKAAFFQAANKSFAAFCTAPKQLILIYASSTYTCSLCTMFVCYCTASVQSLMYYKSKPKSLEPKPRIWNQKI